MTELETKLAEALRLLHGKLSPNVNGADETYFFIGLREQVSMAEMQRATEALRLYDEAKAQPVQDLPPLPEPCDEIAQADGFNVIGTVSVFTADQMHAYARAALAARPAPAEPVAWLYTLEYGTRIADRKVSLEQLRYPFGVCGADYLRVNDDGTSYVRETPLRANGIGASTGGKP